MVTVGDRDSGRTSTGTTPREPGDRTRSRTVVAIDCHVHTNDSFDSTERVDAVLKRAAGVGLDGVVVTDHDAVSNSLSAARRAGQYGLIGIPGVELSTADGHLLGIGVERCPPSGRPFAASVAAIRDAGGIAVVPHPFQRSRHGVSAATITDCDGVEVLNAHTLTGFRNRQAEGFARTEDYPRFGGSDAHRAAAVGRAFTAVEVDSAAPTAADVVDAMRAGRTRAEGGRIPPTEYVRKLATNAKRNSSRILPVV